LGIVEPLLPPRRYDPRGGRPRSVPDRNCLAGIIYMTCASIPWELLPARELGCGSYATCWRRFAEWTEAGVWDALHLALLDRLGPRIGWTGHGCWSTPPACGPREGDHTGANPVDRAKAGSKLHLATDAQGLPLVMAVTAANVHDSQLFEALLDELPAIRTPSGQRRSRPGRVCADKGYDHPRCRGYLAGRRIASRIARRGIESSERLGRHRWKVERSLAWLGCLRLPRFDGQGWWLGQATWARASLRVVVSNSSGVM
jgi:transposase